MSGAKDRTPRAVSVGMPVVLWAFAKGAATKDMTANNEKARRLINIAPFPLQYDPAINVVTAFLSKANPIIALRLRNVTAGLFHFSMGMVCPMSLCVEEAKPHEDSAHAEIYISKHNPSKKKKGHQDQCR
jgi:hypothetical protein